MTETSALYTDDDNVLPLPPDVLAYSSPAGFWARVSLVAGAMGLLGGLAVVQVTWWLSVLTFVVWLMGVATALCLGSLLAKKHRAGTGYPADAGAWARTFRTVFVAGVAVTGLATVALAAGIANTLATPTAPASFTPAVLAAVVTVLAIAAAVWVASSGLHWLFYGTR